MGKSLKLKQNKILIMCGGRGKRLGSISKSIHKPLMNIGKRTILEYKVEQYQRQGFNDFIFCVGYKGELIPEDHEGIMVGNNCFLSIQYLVERPELDSSTLQSNNVE